MSAQQRMDGEFIAHQTERLLLELGEAAKLREGQLVVFGVSTSEVLGSRIGTGGTEEVAASIYAGMQAARAKLGFVPVFQCCEHLNRALVLEREAAEQFGLEQVSVVPVAKAGGSMAAYAYRHLEEAVVVESVQAHAGIDIGDTFIGMHLKRVAVPVRPSIRELGQAHVTMAFTRPKLIGGARAVYELPEAEKSDGNGVGSCL